MKRQFFTIFKIVFFLGLAICLMFFAFKEIKFSDLIDGLESANVFLIVVSVLVGIIGYFARALRWKILIDSLGYNIPLRNAYNALMTGYLFNFAIPRIGEISRCAILKKTDNVEFGKSFGTVIVERCYDLLLIVFSVIIVFLVRFDIFGRFIYDKIAKALYDKFSALPILFYIAFAVFCILIVILGYIYRQRIKQFSGVKKIKNIIKGLLAGLRTGVKMKNGTMFFVYTLIIYFCYVLSGFFILKAIPETNQLSFIDAIFLFVLGALGWVVPVQGGFGSYHILIALGLGLYGIEYNNGIIFATISHESQVIFMFILGVISFISLFIKYKNAKKIMNK